jgi:hypothetical protein
MKALWFSKKIRDLSPRDTSSHSRRLYVLRQLLNQNTELYVEVLPVPNVPDCKKLEMSFHPPIVKY